MVAQLLGRDKGTPLVILGLEHDDVDLGKEEEEEEDRGAEAGAQTKGDHLVAAAEVQRDEGGPDDARGVHAEADELGLVEVLGKVARLDGVHGAQDDQEDVVAEGTQHGQQAVVALELCLCAN